MNLIIEEGLDRKKIESFLNSSVEKIQKFADNHRTVIEDCSIFIKKDNYVLCFCARRNKEFELFVLNYKKKIGSETLLEAIENSSPKPLEYAWEEVQNTEIRRA